MTGRQEATIKTENKIEKLISDQPEIIRKYYKSLEQKTAQTKRVYINYVIEYFEYLKNQNVNVFDINVFSNMKKMDIDEYLASTKYKVMKDGTKKENGESIRRSKIFAVKNFYEFLADNEYININPCNKVKLPSLTQEIKVVALTEEEVEIVKRRIINRKEGNWKRDLAIFVIGVRTGLRIESIIEINLEDINFDEQYITVTEKGNKQREVFFGEDTKNILLQWIEERGDMKTSALFVNDKNERITYAVPQFMLKKYATGFGKKITCHKMRSTSATNLYDATGDIYLVAEVLGHKNIANTRRYANISQKKRKEAASILDKL